MIGLDESFEDLEFVFADMATRGSNKRAVRFDFDDMDIEMPDDEYIPSSPQRSVKKKIVESVHRGFAAISLYKHLKVEATDSLGKETIKYLCNLTFLYKCEDNKRYYYHLHVGSTPVNFTITLIKGSLCTYAWATEARYDECILLEVITNNACHLLWVLDGVNPDTMQLLQYEHDWTAWCFLHQSLSKISPEVARIGVHCFATTLSRIFLHLPMMEKYKDFMEPMPAALMYRDMMQQSFPCLLRGFTQHDLYHPHVQADGSGVKIADFSHLLPNMPTLIITELARHKRGQESVILLLNAVSHDGSILRYVCAQWLSLLQYLHQPQLSCNAPDIQLLNETVNRASGEATGIDFLLTSHWGHDAITAASPLQASPPLVPQYTPSPSASTSHSPLVQLWRTGDIIYVPLLMFGFKVLTEEEVMRNSDTPPTFWYVKGTIMKKHKKIAELYFECFDARIQKHLKFLEHDCKSVLDEQDRLLCHAEAESLMRSQGVPISHVKGKIASHEVESNNEHM